MLLKKYSYLLISGLFGVLIAQADAMPAGPKFSIGVQTGHQKISIKNADRDASGWTTGANASAAYHFYNHFFLKGSVDGSFGKLKGSHTSYSDVSAHIGHHFSLQSDNYVSPYLGIGHKEYHLKKHSTKSSFVYPYLAFGARFKLPLSRLFGLEIGAEYDWQFGGRVKLSNASVGKKSVHMDSGKIHGFKGDIMLVNKLANNASLAFGPYVNTQNANSVKGAGKAHYTEVGLKVSYNF